MDRNSLQQEKLFSAILRNVSDGIVAIDPELQVMFINPAAGRMCGWDEEAARKKPVQKVLSLTNSVDLSSIIPNVLPFDDVPRFFRDVILKNQEGDISIIDGSITKIQTAEGEPPGFILIFRDISEVRKMSAVMDFNASHDAQTGLNNIDTFARKLQESIDLLKREGGGNTVIGLQIDQYSSINDEAGSQAVDELIRQMAVLFRSNIQRRDIAARFSDEGFVLLIRSCTGEDAMRVAQRLLEASHAYRFHYSGKEYSISFSIVLEEVKTGDEKADAVLASAGEGAAKARAEGGDRIYVQ
ncbi:MAG: diguanylate cyclase [Treponema sp.]|jgi:diguanylate cyclase (GGDEF)-like protein/PAS domain S-box-containing protein|nr:diguanylate cyclase [Treponema sp.]